MDLGNILVPTRHGFVDRLRRREFGLIGRHIVAAFAVDIIGHAQRDFLQAGKHVELGEHDVGQAVDLSRITVHHRIKPATTTRATRSHAILMTLRTQPLAILAKQLSRERSFAHAGHVRFGNTNHTADLGRTDTSTGACAAGGRVGGCDERIRAVIHVEHGGLAAFEQHGLAFIKCLIEHQRGVGHIRLQTFAELEQLVGSLVHVDRTAVVQLDEHLILLMQARLDLVMQMFGVEQVVHADAHAVDLVRVGRADATAGGADLMLAEEAFGHLVQHAMVRSDDMRAFAHQQPGAVHATALQTIDFFEQHFRIHDHAIADNRSRGRADDAGGQQVQRIRFVTNDHGMARIVAAIETRNIVDLGADKIGRLALTFVAHLSVDRRYRRCASV